MEAKADLEAKVDLEERVAAPRRTKAEVARAEAQQVEAVRDQTQQVAQLQVWAAAATRHLRQEALGE